MIGQSFAAYIFIRTFLFCFRSITPVCILYILSSWTILPARLCLPAILEVIPYSEALFYFLVYLPKHYSLQRPTIHPPPLSRSERGVLLTKCLDTIPDIKQYALLWSNNPLREIKRDNVKEWICWASMNKDTWNEEEDEELESYIDRIESTFSIKLKSGRGHAKSLRLSLDDFTTLHRPLLFYVFGVGGSDFKTCCILWKESYQLYTPPGFASFFDSFPYRPFSLISGNNAPTKHTSYWYRPHTSNTHIPVLFIHGVGIGLHTYIELMKDFKRLSGNVDPEGTIGFIALEIMPISFRLSHAPLGRQEICAEILNILNLHKWNKFVLLSQSYGTVISTHMLHDPDIGPRITSMVHLDPVTWLLHLPEVGYNFTRRVPREANEHQLWYFACTDIGIAHTLARNFFWSDSVLWKEDIGQIDITVILAAKDIVVNTEEVGRYLTRPAGVKAVDDNRGDEWKVQEWKGKGLDVIWLPQCDHGEVVDTKLHRKLVIDILMEYCKKARMQTL